MPDPDLLLYHYPGACSQVAVYALETAGLPYRVELVDLAGGQQATPEYLAVSPLGKVPMLVVDGEPLGENAAILTFIAALRPDAGVFPDDPSPRSRAEIVGGMSFCGGTVHPQVRGLANPQRVTTGDGEPVREMSRKLLGKSFAYAEKRLSERGWWLGRQSAVDVYLQWTVGVARKFAFDLTAFPQVSGLGERLAGDEAFAAMQAAEQSHRATLGI